MNNVIVVTGAGGMGEACIRRIGTGYKVILCDFNTEILSQVTEELSLDGYDITAVQMDVSSQKSVENAAKLASELGSLHAIIHTAGLSPTMASTKRILEVDLIGTANIIFAFEPYIVGGTVGVFISSSSSYLVRRDFSNEEEKAISSFNPTELNDYLPKLEISNENDAYTVSKYCNRLQIAGAAIRWGSKGGRIMSVSPGVISTPMGKKERETNPTIDYMINNAPVKRAGTAADVSGVVEFIISSAGGFLSGSDILLDGGVTAFFKYGNR